MHYVTYRIEQHLQNFLSLKNFLPAKYLVQNNVAFQKLLTDGIDVEVKQKDGSKKTEKAYIFDAKDIENNEFLAINQYTVIENGKERRPDIVAFLNGIPVVVIELKNAINEEGIYLL